MFSHRKITKTRWLLILVAALIFSGCGQKGALYLPDDTTTEAAQT